jgi:chorismate mutase/prephenate dehydratase
LSKQATKDASATDLVAIRKRIDEVDRQIQALINERATYAQQVGISKGAFASAVDYYRPEREAEVLRAVLERNKGPLRDEEMLRLFREIMSACLAQQEPLKIGYLGPEGTFTQTAVYKHFGHSVRGLPFSTMQRGYDVRERHRQWRPMQNHDASAPKARGCNAQKCP